MFFLAHVACLRWAASKRKTWQASDVSWMSQNWRSENEVFVREILQNWKCKIVKIKLSCDNLPKCRQTWLQNWNQQKNRFACLAGLAFDDTCHNLQAITTSCAAVESHLSLVKCPMLQVEKEILADIEEDFALKSKCREFREKLAKRADRKKERQEEKEKQQNLTYKMIWGGKTYMDNGQILVNLRLYSKIGKTYSKEGWWFLFFCWTSMNLNGMMIPDDEHFLWVAKCLFWELGGGWLFVGGPWVGESNKYWQNIQKPWGITGQFAFSCGTSWILKIHVFFWYMSKNKWSKLDETRYLFFQGKTIKERDQKGTKSNKPCQSFRQIKPGIWLISGFKLCDPYRWMV